MCFSDKQSPTINHPHTHVACLKPNSSILLAQSKTQPRNPPGTGCHPEDTSTAVWGQRTCRSKNCFRQKGWKPRKRNWASMSQMSLLIGAPDTHQRLALARSVHALAWREWMSLMMWHSCVATEKGFKVGLIVHITHQRRALARSVQALAWREWMPLIMWGSCVAGTVLYGLSMVSVCRLLARCVQALACRRWMSLIMWHSCMTRN